MKRLPAPKSHATLAVDRTVRLRPAGPAPIPSAAHAFLRAMDLRPAVERTARASGAEIRACPAFAPHDRIVAHAPDIFGSLGRPGREAFFEMD